MYLITRQTACRILAHILVGVLSHALVTAAVPLIAAIQAVRHSVTTRPGRYAVVAAMSCQIQALQDQRIRQIDFPTVVSVLGINHRVTYEYYDYFFLEK